MEKNNPLLQKFQQQARDAHYWTSFSPEKRGDQMISDFSEELTADIEELKNADNVSAESIADYQTRYERFFSSYLSAKSRCISSAITGPAKFPTRRAEKANRSEENHYAVFREWRKRAKKAIIRKAQPVKTFVSELERYRTELTSCEGMQQLMKTCNAIIRKAKGKDCTHDLMGAGLSEETAYKIQRPTHFGGPGYASFHLTNNNANIKRIVERIKILETKEQCRTEAGEITHSFTGGIVIVNYEVDRVQIKHNTKPPAEIIGSMKRNGFKWSPSNMAWQRKITREAIYKTNVITGLTITIPRG